MKFHGILSAADFRKLVAEADVGLNCQRMSDPISGVTFPSKLFSYLSDGLLVISSRACQADRVCPEACLFYEEESPGALAKAMRQAITDLAGLRQQLRIEQVFHRYSPEETAKRLRRLLDSARLL